MSSMAMLEDEEVIGIDPEGLSVYFNDGASDSADDELDGFSSRVRHERFVPFPKLTNRILRPKMVGFLLQWTHCSPNHINSVLSPPVQMSD